MAKPVHSGLPRWLWVALLIGVTLVLLVGGFWYYRAERERIRTEKYQEIAAIAALKAGQIQAWRQERLGDAKCLLNDPFFRQAVQQWLQNKSDTGLRARLRDRLLSEQKAYRYADVLLLDPECRILLSAEPHPHRTGSFQKKTLERALASGGPILSDFYRFPQGTVHVDTIGPILGDDGRMVAGLILRSNAGTELYPLIQFWPTQSKTAETLLIRKESDSVLFLNELRHRQRTALSMREPLDREDLPAVQAVLGKKGIFLGRDYRDREVVSDLRPIADSNWFMVAKLDRSEILEEAYYRGKTIALFCGLFIVMAASLTAFGYTRRQAGLFEELYRNEKEQRETQEKFRMTLYNISDAVITTDTAALIRQMNPPAERLTGWPECEAQGNPLSDVFQIVDEDSLVPDENLVRLTNLEEPLIEPPGHTLLIARDASESPIAYSGGPIRDENGRVIGAIVVFRDQTRERKFQRELENSRQLLQEVGRMARVGGWEVDADSLQVRWTEETYRIHEMPLHHKPPLGEAINFFHKEDQPKLRRAIQESLEKGTPYDMELRFVTATGNKLWTRTICKPDIVDGKVIRLRGTFQDITERRLAEEALRDSEERFRSTFELAAVGIAHVAPDGRWLRMNRRLCDIVGYTADELKEMTFQDVTHPDDLDADLAQAHRLLEGEIETYSMEKRYIRKAGSVVWINLTGSLVRRPSGEPNYFIAVVEDISDRKRVEEELNKMVTELERSNRELEQFAYVASHDLQEPLRMVSSYTQLLAKRLEDHLDEKSKKFIDYAVDGAVRMQQLIHDLLLFSRVTTRGAPFETMDSHSAFGKALRNLQEAIHESGAVVTNDDLPSVIADETQLSQVFQNLISNAIKFKGEYKPRIHVSAHEDDYSWVFSVRDNGIGIDARYKDKLFVIFQRLHTRQEYPGTGIGLALCQRIVQRHGGEIWFESKPGEGSTFFFSLSKETREGHVDETRTNR